MLDAYPQPTAEKLPGVVGARVGESVVGDGVGMFVGISVGDGVGVVVGDGVGAIVGESVVGDGVGAMVGEGVVGDGVGIMVGEGVVGDGVGTMVGDSVVGDGVGSSVGEGVVGEGVSGSVVWYEPESATGTPDPQTKRGTGRVRGGVHMSRNNMSRIRRSRGSPIRRCCTPGRCTTKTFLQNGGGLLKTNASHRSPSVLPSLHTASLQ